MTTLQEKYTNLTSMADNARTQQWDTRKELRKVSQPRPAKMNSLAGSKKSFKRNRNHDNLILNERSGDLLSNMSQSKLTPQEIFKHFENQQLLKDAKKAKLPPSYRSTAERNLERSLNKHSSTNIKMSLMQLAQSKIKIVSPTASKSDISTIHAASKSQSPMNQSQSFNAKAKYRPVPIQPAPKKNQLKMLSTARSNFKFDVNEAANKEAHQAIMNQSIMSQLQTQEVATPKSKLPRKLQEKERKTDSTNRDIEAFIASPLKRKSPKLITPEKIK